VKHDADDAIARLLRGRVEAGPPAGPCLDAEMVAAWFDGTLTPARQREAESHASTCARCQALLAAMAQTEPVAPPSRRSLSMVRWFAPALAAAAAVFVWINVASRSAEVPQAPSDAAPASDAASAAPAQTAAPQEALDRRSALRAETSQPAVSRNKQETGAAAAAPAPSADRRAQLKDDANRGLQRDALMASPALPPIVRSADGSLWRIARDGTVGRSRDNGATWREQNLGSSVDLLAGSSPSPDVVWFAGTGGIVVVTIDGASWQWRSLPERVDVTGIAAVDGRTATATTRDGRRFITHDGGLTWVPAGVQENPAAPF